MQEQDSGECVSPLVALFLVLDACRCLLVPEKYGLLTVDLASGMRTASTGCLCPACFQSTLGLGPGCAGSLTYAQGPTG